MPVVMVTGPMSSCNRILTRVLASGPDVRAFVDKSHGTKDQDTHYDLVVFITRNRQKTEESIPIRHLPERIIPIDDSLKGVAKRYPDALKVTYEELVHDADGVIAKVADELYVDPWPNKWKMFDANQIPPDKKDPSWTIHPPTSP